MKTKSAKSKVVDALKEVLGPIGVGMPTTQMGFYIEQACEPTRNKRPNMSLNMEICDLINKNGKTYPRDAAFDIVRKLNQSSGHAKLAIGVLDSCAKNCGYPFHLVMSSKEFLNELVRRFPEQPKSVSSTQKRVLEMLAEWNVVYAQNSRYKEDFKHINDMCRLLEYKGYRIPQVSKSLNTFEPEVNLKTEDQLEEEDKKNNGLKLEELIRKGTPAALAEANDMMKLMSGYDVSKKPDYKAEVNEELDRIESRVILLNDMLNQITPEEFKKKIDSTIEDLHGSGKTAQNRLMKFIEENDDEARMVRLLEMNDLINMVMNKYDDLKRGNEVQKNAIDRHAAQVGSLSSEPAGGAINLIDFDAFDSLPVQGSPQQLGMSSDIMGGMQGLNFGNYPQQVQQSNNFGNQMGTNQQSNFGQFGSNQQTNNSGMGDKQSMQNNFGQQFNNFQQPQQNAQMKQGNQSNPFDDLLSLSSNSSSQKPQNNMSQLNPENNGFDLMGGINMMAQPQKQQNNGFDMMGGNNMMAQQQKPQNTGFDLMGGNNIKAQPQKQQNTGFDMMGGNNMMAQQQKPQNTGFDLMGGNNIKAQPQKQQNTGFDMMGGNNMMAQQQKPQNNAFDLMGGNSMMPQPQKQQNTGFDMMGGNNMISQPKQQLPPMNKECKENIPHPAYSNTNPLVLIFDKNGLQIKLDIPLPTTTPQILAKATFINVTPVIFNDFNFQVSLPKSMTVQLSSTSTVVQAFNQCPVIQTISIQNQPREPLRMRFKVSYSVNGAMVTEMGEYVANS